MEYKLPNFLIVGASRSGTTSIYHYLRQHPEIYLSPLKEPNFLSDKFTRLIHKGVMVDKGKNIIKNFEEYKRLFLNAKNEKAIGEVSPENLLFYEDAIKRIKKYLGEVKIIIILRNPIERAFSYYVHLIKEFGNFLSFEETLEMKEEEGGDGWMFYGPRCLSGGFYYNQVKAYLDNFNQCKIYLYDDLQKDTLALLKDIFEFLNVDSLFIPNVEIKYNISGIPKNKIKHEFLNKLIRSVILARIIKRLLLPKDKRIEVSKFIHNIKSRNLEKPQLKPETREYLKNLYREDILKLQSLLKRDLSHWLR